MKKSRNSRKTFIRSMIIDQLHVLIFLHSVRRGPYIYLHYFIPWESSYNIGHNASTGQFSQSKISTFHSYIPACRTQMMCIIMVDIIYYINVYNSGHTAHTTAKTEAAEKRLQELFLLRCVR